MKQPQQWNDTVAMLCVSNTIFLTCLPEVGGIMCRGAKFDESHNLIQSPAVANIFNLKTINFNLLSKINSLNSGSPAGRKNS